MTQSPEEPTEQHRFGTTMMVIAWSILLIMLAFYFNEWLQDRANPNQNPATMQMGNRTEVRLLPNHQHHYVVSGEINGEPVTFMLDTGATDVVVPANLADRLNLQRGQQGFATTANGTVSVYRTQLASLQIGDIRLNDIRASINPGMREPIVLLGMSALREIEFAQRGDMLILRQ